jgi:predicted lipoprotein with Yx(FWY)xxD motif
VSAAPFTLSHLARAHFTTGILACGERMGRLLRGLVYPKAVNHERRDAMRGKWWAPAGFAAAALVLAACGSSPSSSGGSAAASSSPSAAASSAAPASGTTLKFTMINGKRVLTNAQGMVLYWFVPDTSTKSNCTASCLKYWPPVPGPATAGTGIHGMLGVITTAGVKQVTYRGHPLYTYVADTSPGTDKGNGLNLSGGLWWAMTASGAKLAMSSSSGSSTGGSTGGGGY